MMEQNKDLVNHNNHMSDIVNTENKSKGDGQAVPDEANQTSQNTEKQQQNTDDIYSFNKDKMYNINQNYAVLDRPKVPRLTNSHTHLPKSSNVTMKPQLYEGDEDLDEYLAQFEILAEINGWNYATKSLYLAAEKSELFRAKLQTRMRGKEESLPELAQSIKKLTRQAYPSAQSTITSVLALEHFIDALQDADLRLRLRESNPKSIHEAETLAVRLETLKLAERQKGRMVRQADSVQTNAKFNTELNDDKGEDLKSLKNELSDFKREMISLSRNIKDEEDIQTSEFVNSVAGGQTIVNKGRQLPDYLHEVFESNQANLDKDQKEKFRDLLIEYSDIFSKSSEDIGLTDLVEHTINTGNNPPVRQRPRRIPLARMKDAEAEIQKMVKQDIIEPSTSPWNSNIVLSEIVRVCTRSKDYGCSQNEKDDPVKEINFENVSESQLSDDVISIIIQWKIDEVKPIWADVSHMSPEVKFYWSRLNSLILVNGILYRKWESYNGKHYDLHIVLPANFKSKHQRDWDEYIYLLMLAYQSSEHESLGTSPCSLLFGREVNLPVDLVLGRPETEKSLLYLKTIYAYELSQKLEVIHKFARNKLKLSSDRMKRNYDVGTKMQTFDAGDPVWLHNPRRVKGLCPKLQNNWEGPYIVVNKLNDVIYRIQKGPKTKPKVVHQDRLKPYLGENVPIWLN
ncbi:Hypothetical predicted protein [Mytilus galloprovincialis]|uniref:Integrase p58-like C-terminal domain-containing protein n=1 Tax=Mytilus galloprovincialis TaxID=29158 RepID=A0A8B6H885_MYTGA|nr:Hypothetical predicted protein [Mytilus galloprovincialis]